MTWASSGAGKLFLQKGIHSFSLHLFCISFKGTMAALTEQTELQGNLHIAKGFHFFGVNYYVMLTRESYLCEAGTWWWKDTPLLGL